jgi:hypothetical protein
MNNKPYMAVRIHTTASNMLSFWTLMIFLKELKHRSRGVFNFDKQFFYYDEKQTKLSFSLFIPAFSEAENAYFHLPYHFSGIFTRSVKRVISPFTCRFFGLFLRKFENEK